MNRFLDKGQIPDAQFAQPRTISIEDLENETDSPFFREEPVSHRWLITTCVVGAVGSVMIGGALLGLFGSGTNTQHQIAASETILPSVQKSAISGKGNFDGNAVNPIETKVTKVVTRPYRNTDQSGPVSGSLVFKFEDLTRTLMPKPIEAAFAPPTEEPDTREPVVLDGTFVVTPEDNSENITNITKSAPPPEPVDKTFTLAKGETLIAKLQENGISEDAATALAAAIEPVFPGKLMRAGQIFTVTLDTKQDFYGNEIIYPVQVSFSPGPKEEIIVEADEDGRFVARVDGDQERTRSRYAEIPPHFRSRGRISSSLYATAKDKGVPDYIVNQVIKAFSYSVDFQRQVKAGDKFDIFFGQPLSGSSKKRKVMHYAALTVGGKRKTFYRFTPPNGRTGYYDENGQSAARSLMRTPISGARISSGFGMRRHPILGYSKLHTGVDFAAPRGTPIRAGGSGTVEYARWRGGYGRTVILRHGKRYTTLYAHMSRIASGIRPGRKVQQGQVIGYVGSTGRSTGPHLHYEVRLNKRPVDPRRVRVAGGAKLTGKDLAAFKKHKLKITALMKQAPTTTQLAQVSE